MIKQKRKEKSVGVTDSTWQKLQMIKITGSYRSIEEVILKLLGEKK